MSARTEQLLVEIKQAEERFAAANQAGDTVAAQKAAHELKTLTRQLAQASEALTEGKQVLKG